MKKTLLLLTALLTGASGACWAKAAGTSGAQFLRISVDARASALGETGAASAGAESIFLNPAGLMNAEKPELKLSQVLWVQDISFSNVAFARPGRTSAWGIGANYLALPSLAKYDNTGTRLSDTFAPNDLSALFSFAWKTGKRSSLGFNLKYISSALDDVRASAVALDFGGQKQYFKRRLNLGFVVQNAGTPLKYNKESDPLPMNVKLGGQFLIPVESQFERYFDIDQEVRLLSDVNYCVDSGFFANGGIEYVRNYSDRNTLAFRAGYRTNVEKLSGSGFSAGVGFKYEKYALDYSFAPYGDLGQAHRISLALQF